MCQFIMLGLVVTCNLHGPHQFMHGALCLCSHYACGHQDALCRPYMPGHLYLLSNPMKGCAFVQVNLWASVWILHSGEASRKTSRSWYSPALMSSYINYSATRGSHAQLGAKQGLYTPIYEPLRVSDQSMCDHSWINGSFSTVIYRDSRHPIFMHF